MIRAAGPDDGPAIVAIARAVVQAGTSYAFAPDTTDEALRRFFFPGDPGAATFVALDGDTVVGVYVMKPNGVGRAAHVANAAYMVAAGASGRGVGLRMGEHSLGEARRRGYRAMQFNAVVSTNDRAVALWKRLGFEVVGTLPGAFSHPDGRYVDVYVMFKTL